MHAGPVVYKRRAMRHDHHQRVGICVPKFRLVSIWPLGTRPLYSKSAPPGDIEMDQLLRNQGAQILGDKLKCNNSWQTHKNSKYHCNEPQGKLTEYMFW